MSPKPEATNPAQTHAPRQIPVRVFFENANGAISSKVLMVHAGIAASFGAQTHSSQTQRSLSAGAA